MKTETRKDAIDEKHMTDDPKVHWVTQKDLLSEHDFRMIGVAETPLLTAPYNVIVYSLMIFNFIHHYPSCGSKTKEMK